MRHETRGRKRRFTDEKEDTIRKLAADGEMSITKLAALMGCPRSTIYEVLGRSRDADQDAPAEGSQANRGKSTGDAA